MVRARLILIFLIISPAVFSQVIGQSNFVWLRGGLGGFQEQKINELGGVSINLGINFFNQRTVERQNSVRKANDLFEIRLGGYMNSGDEHEMAWYYDLGLLYGKAAGDVLRLFACAGVGLIGGTYYNVESRPGGSGGQILSTVSHSFLGFNIPLEAGISINSPVIGIGIAGFANINKTQPLVGFHLTLQVGRITKFPRVKN